MVADLTCFPNNITDIIAIGKKEIQIPANTGPLNRAIPIPARHTTKEYIKFPTFSPIADYIIAKFSPICEGSCSIFCNSKNATSCFKNACKYLLLRLKEIFSATCCRKA